MAKATTKGGRHRNEFDCQCLPSLAVKSTESIFMLGHRVYDEAAVSELVGGLAARFFTLAQRIVWGVSQSDLVRVDVEAARAAVVKEYGRSPVAHLLDAFACLARGRQDLAEAARERATTLASGHPLAWLCPTDAEWAGEIPDQTLEEVIPGRLWRTRSWFQTQGTRLRSSGNGTLVRTDSGDLAFLNAVALSDAVAARIDQLGEVRWLTTGSKAHSIYVPGLVGRYPHARNLGVAGHATHPASRHLKFDGVLGVDDGLPNEFEVLILDGSEMPDAQIFHGPTRTLVSTHLAGSNLKSELQRESDFFGRLYGLAFGLIDDVGWLAYQTILWTDLPALQRSLRRVLAWDFERIASDHNDRVFEHDIKDRIREVLDWTAQLEPGHHRRMVARFFWYQPRFLYDMLRYKLRTRAAP